MGSSPERLETSRPCFYDATGVDPPTYLQSHDIVRELHV